ncbi:MAG: hypothetical protein K8S16_02790 [Bacteroidales bacterium]|nr:hypothetical protein [Bacteroidales bacterium]
MAEISKMNYKGKTIFLADHRGSQDDEVIANQEKLLELVSNEKTNEALTLTDMTGVFTTRKVHKELSRIGDDLMARSKKAAIVGMASGAKKILITAYMDLTRQPMKLFDTVEEAREWLVSN